eukprot:g3391.t1
MTSLILLSFVLFSLSTVYSTDDVLELKLFSNDVVTSSGARCLDGTPAGYYIRKSATNSPNWVVFLQGGGLCVEPIDCRKRIHSGLGSSKYWGQNHTGSNVYSLNDANPLKDWNHVWVPYCSGDTWQGLRTKTDAWYGGYTAGHLILTTVLDHLWNTTSMGKLKKTEDSAGTLLFTGESAGGIGVFANADYVTSYMKEKNPSMVVKAAPQSGFYFPADVTIYQDFWLHEKLHLPITNLAWLEGMVVNWIEDAWVDQSCVAATGSKGKCWDVSTLSKYITTPLLVIENLFDQNQITGVLACLNCKKGSMTKDSTQAHFLTYYMQAMKKSLTSFSTIKPEQNSVFAPSCFEHTGDLQIPGSPQINNVSLADAFRKWVLEDEQFVLLDQCSGNDPCNPKCIIY